MVPPEQTGAPVLAFDQERVRPGDTARVVIVPPFPPIVAAWSRVQVGDDLPMYEGAKVCGYGRVLWRRQTTLPVPAEDEARYRRWLAEGSEYSEPDED
jgi:hypothetical protein